MNSLAKIVFSGSLPAAEWNNSRLVRSDAAEEVARLKQGPGGDMVIFGSAKLASSLLQSGLIDEYRVILSPVLIGAGKSLFQDVRERMKLRLARTQQLRSGVVILYYETSQT